MDFQRNILLVALLVVSYLLFLSWQQDYHQQQPAVAAQATSVAPAAAGSDLPGAPAAVAASAGDLAGLAPAAPATGDIPGAAAASAVASGAGHVRVLTDVFELDIDLAGGDIDFLKLRNYTASLETPEHNVELFTNKGYVYEAQSGLVALAGAPVDSDKGRAVYSAAASRYEMAAGADTLEVVLSLPPQDGVTVDKIYRFVRGDYLVRVSYRVRNDSAAAWTGFLFGQLKRDGVADPSHPDSGGFFSANPSYLGAAYGYDTEPYNKYTLADMAEKPLDQPASGGWISFIQHYFLAAWVPTANQPNKFTTRYNAETNQYILGFTSPAVSVAPGTQQEISAALFAGPKLQERLGEIARGMELTVDYGWFWFISQPLAWLLVQLHGLLGNWGLAIIGLTVLVKILFYYPSHVSYRSMAHMRRITPELMRIREQYKDDRQKQAQEMMNLYRKEKVNPMGGCLPILVQMPVFIALYWVLLESVELRQAPFFFWIQDLSVMDPYFVLPILMGISMWAQMKLNPAPPDPMQAKVMGWLPWIFTLFFLFFAAGLVLYWLVNNLLSIAQQWYITRQIEREYAKD